MYDLNRLEQSQTKMKDYSHQEVMIRGATTAEKLRGPRFRSQHRGGCACWVLSVAGGRSLPMWGSGVSPRENFWKFWWLLSVKFLAFWKPRPRSWGPVSPGPFGCCAYGYDSTGVGGCREVKKTPIDLHVASLVDIFKKTTRLRIRCKGQSKFC